MTMGFRLAYMMLAAACTITACVANAQQVDPEFAGQYSGFFTRIPSEGDGGFATAELATTGILTISLSAPNTPHEGCSFATGQYDLTFQPGTDGVSASGFGQIEGCANNDFNLPAQVSLRIVVEPDITWMTFTICPMTGCGTDVVQAHIPKMGTETEGVASRQRSSIPGMWYSPRESGWGLSVTLGSTSSQVPFVVLNAYSGSQPTWFVMPRGKWTSALVFSGDLYSPSGVDYRAPGFDPTKVTMNKVGSMTITFSPDSSRAPSGVLKYSILQSGGTAFEATKSISKQLF